MLKYFLAGAVGLGLGYAICLKHLEQEYNDRVDLEVEEVKAYYVDKIQRMEEDNKDSDLDYGDVLTGTEEIVEYHEAAAGYQSDATLVPGWIPKTTLVNYHKGPELDPRQAPVINLSVGPIQISEQAFIEEASGYEQIQLNYYMDDDVLTDAQNVQVYTMDERDHIIGVHLETIKNALPGDGITYFRNDRLKKEYEIYRNQSAYSEMVAGESADG